MSNKTRKLILLIILLVALAVRVYRLPAQSIWFDEWLHYNLLDSPDWHTFYSLFVFIAPEQASAPVYYCLFYLSSFLFGLTPVLLRIFPVALGVASVYLLYYLGCRIKGSKAGLIAASLMALSPQNTWYSQELRPYTLVVFLVLVSTIITLQIGKSRSRGWLFLHFAVNGLLIFTHLFAFLALVPQSVYLLVKTGIRRTIMWGVVQGVFVLGILFTAFNLPHFSLYPSQGPPLPSAREFLLDLVSKDIVNVYRIPTTLTESMSPLPGVLAPAAGMQPFADGAQAALMGVFLLLYVLRVLRKGVKQCKPLWGKESAFAEKGGHRAYAGGSAISLDLVEDSENVRGNNFPEDIFLVMLLIGPPAVLVFGQALLGLPFYNVGYDLYCSVALYVIVGIVLSRSARAAGTLLAGILIALYVFQSVMFVPRTTRPAWDCAAEYIKRTSTAEDIILDETLIAPTSRRRPYFETCNLAMVPAASYWDACDKSVHYLGALEEPERQERVSVWLVTEMTFARLGITDGSEPTEFLKKILRECGLRGTFTMFPGGTELAVVRIQRIPNVTPAISESHPSDLAAPGLDDLLAQLISKSQHMDNPGKSLGSLQRAIGLWPALFIHSYFTHIGSLILYGEAELAESYARHILERFPGFGPVYFGLGMALAVQGQGQRAIPYFEESFSSYSALEETFRPFVEAVCVRGDFRMTKGEWARIYGFPFPIYGIVAEHIVQGLEHRKDLPSNEERSLPFALAGERDGNGEEIYSDPDTTGQPGEVVKESSSPIWNVDESCLPQYPTSWAETLFEIQERQSGVNAWMPLGKRLYLRIEELWAERVVDANSSVKMYERLLQRHPFESRLYRGYNNALAKCKAPETFVARWVKQSAGNPDIAVYAAKRLAEAGTEWIARGDEVSSILAYRAAAVLDKDNMRYVLRLAQIYEYSGQVKEAVVQYTKVLEKVPDMKQVSDRVNALSVVEDGSGQ